VPTVACLWAGVLLHPDGMVKLIAIVASVRGLIVVFGRAPRPAFQLPDRERWSAAAAYIVLAIALIAAMKASQPAEDPAGSTHRRDGTSASAALRPEAGPARTGS